MSLTAKQLFYEISCELTKHISPSFILSTKTEKGNTQISERIIIQKIGAILDSMGLNYVEAGSQQSKDFRNVGNIDLNIEVKKTDNTTIYFNDTCPSKDIYYIMLYYLQENNIKKHPKKIFHRNCSLLMVRNLLKTLRGLKIILMKLML
jgi:hypothetical protein